MTTHSIEDFLLLYLQTMTGKKCVLFLGPHFGVTADNKTVGDAVREQLKTSPLNRPESDLLNNLDAEFDNLFILKNPSGKERALKNLLSKYYSDLKPGKIYQTIARLPFRAIVSCTPDLMLRKAFDELELEYDFHYYSAEGQAEKAVNPQVPVLYNLFGTADNPETLIVTYEDFFKFVVSLLGHGNNQLPLALRYIFNEAEIFMLFGFDLSKWYVPLIVRKLNQSRSTFGAERLSVLTKDSIYRDESEFKFSTTFVVLDNETELVLNALRDAIAAQGPAARTAPKVPDWLKPLFEDVKLKINEGKVRDALQTFSDRADKLQFPAALATQLETHLSQLVSAENATNLNQMDPLQLLGVKNGSVQFILTDIMPVLKARLDQT